jgi:pimeloyl-ACP methyl ester carboxylesterase
MELVALLVFSASALADCTAPHQHLVETEDGAGICLHHFPGTGESVLLAHGITSNHRVWDLREDLSMRKYLQDAGLDIWLIDFRGDGDAGVAPNGKRQKKGGTIDEYGIYDIHTAISFIKERQQQDKVGFVGYSLSGMSITAYMAEHGDSSLSKLVLLGVPMDYEHPDLVWKLASAVMTLNPVAIPTNTLGRFASKVSRLPLRVEDYIWRPENIDARTRRELLNNIFSPMSRKELKQIAKSIRQEEFRSLDGTLRYAEVLPKQSLPTLVIAGRADLISPADRSYAYYSLIGAKEKSFILAGRAEGFSTDYGHACLAMSWAAQRELFPIIGDWFLEPLPKAGTPEDQTIGKEPASPEADMSEESEAIIGEESD